MELVVHVFLPATGPEREAAHRWVHHVWRRCAEVAGLDRPVAALSPLPAVPPDAVDDMPGGSRPVAACTSPGPGVHQALLRREHDLLCLSVVLAPPPPTGWAALERLWERLTDNAPGPAPMIGQARLFLAAGAGTPPPEAAVTRSGFRVWEESTRDDQRRIRRMCDDHSLTEWFTHRLDDDGEYLDATRERISTLTPLIEHVVAHRWQDRRERISLAQAAVVGALVVLLTTAQSLNYDVPLPNAAKSGLVVTAGGAALYLSLLALRAAVPAYRARITRYAHLALAAACSGTVWTVNVATTPVAGLAGTVVPPVAAFVVVWTAATVADLLRRRQSGTA